MREKIVGKEREEDRIIEATLEALHLHTPPSKKALDVMTMSIPWKASKRAWWSSHAPL
jgi:hypothetical protein